MDRRKTVKTDFQGKVLNLQGLFFYILFIIIIHRNNVIGGYMLDKLKETIRKGALREKLFSKEEKKELAKFRIKKPKHLIVLPKTDELEKVNFEYPLLEPYAYAHIYWSKKEGSIFYRVVEPTLRKKEKEYYELIVDSLIELLDVRLSAIKKEEKTIDYIEDKIKGIIEELDIDLNTTEFSKIMYYIYRDFVGLNKIEPLMHDPYIEDIGCDGVEIPVYIVHKKFGSLPTNIVYENAEGLKDFVVKLAERGGRYISYAEPLLDSTLPSGSRIQASLTSDVTTRGPTFSIRKFREEPFSPVDLIGFGTASAEMFAYLWYCIENGLSILICGGVASGKTSFLNALSLFVPPEMKIISIEDTRELNLPHENWIPAVTRLGFGGSIGEEKYGQVTLYDLLKESFRQNPDYVIVGEIRGKEAYVMFQGISSGHPSMTTMHAGGVKSIIRRLTTPPINLSAGLVESLDLVGTMVFAKEKGKSARRVRDLVEIKSIESETGRTVTNTVYSWSPAKDNFYSEGATTSLEKIARSKGIEVKASQKEIKKRAKVLEWMHNTGIKDWMEVSEIINLYYINPGAVMKKIKR